MNPFTIPEFHNFRTHRSFILSFELADRFNTRQPNPYETSF